MKEIRDYIKNLRNEFSASSLDEKTASRSPLTLFALWMKEAIDAKAAEPNAMTLATADAKTIDARIVLLRNFDSKGFSFFTNYKSAKGKELFKNKKACLNFFWPELQRQVRIRGKIEFLSPRLSDQYFASRPRESQIAAWASQQSEVLNSRIELEARFQSLKTKFEGKKIPRPQHWGGYRLVPNYFEFWKGRTNRLHDRIVYEMTKENKWKLFRLNP